MTLTCFICFPSQWESFLEGNNLLFVEKHFFPFKSRPSFERTFSFLRCVQINGEVVPLWEMAEKLKDILTLILCQNDIEQLIKKAAEPWRCIPTTQWDDNNTLTAYEQFFFDKMHPAPFKSKKWPNFTHSGFIQLMAQILSQVCHL